MSQVIYRTPKPNSRGKIGPSSVKSLLRGTERHRSWVYRCLLAMHGRFPCNRDGCYYVGWNAVDSDTTCLCHGDLCCLAPTTPERHPLLFLSFIIVAVHSTQQWEDLFAGEGGQAEGRHERLKGKGTRFSSGWSFISDDSYSRGFLSIFAINDNDEGGRRRGWMYSM